MIAQLIAINHPERVLSLTSIMSTVGGPNVVQAEPAVGAILLAPPGADSRGASRAVVQQPADHLRHRHAVRRRACATEGRARRGSLLLTRRQPSVSWRRSSRHRTERPALGRLTIPTLVIHGENDPLVPPENGRQTAAALLDCAR